jgi:tetratricopeptide (TPR) repeat protein/MinD-like ATPase involved in chromosome partitioning or flagellar assembly
VKQGLIITFYSYKGGVGRSFALANIAATLAVWGYQVLCIDWDLEAPGLNHYFQSWIQTSNKSGMVELITDFSETGRLRWQEHLTYVRFPKAKKELSFISAGNQNDSYAGRVQAINWTALYETNELGKSLELARNEWKSQFDFVFIDSRTGITDAGGICTVQLPDVLAFVFTANRQSLDGAVDVVRRAMNQRTKLPYDRGGLLTLPLISHFDIREEKKLAEEWLGIFRRELASFYQGWADKALVAADIQNHTRIPYFSYWSFGERLPVVEEETSDAESINYHFHTLAALVANGFSSTGLLVENRDSFVNAARWAIRDQQENEPPATHIFLSYSTDDSSIADELASMLRTRGLSIKLSSDSVEPGTGWQSRLTDDLQAAQSFVVLVGKAFDRWQNEQLRTFANINVREGLSRQIVPVLLPEADVDSIPPFLQQFRFIRSKENLERTAEEIDLSTINTRKFEVSDSSLSTLLTKANSFTKLGRFEDARELYRTVLASDPKNVDALVRFAKLEERGTQFSSAKELYREALTINPERVDIRVNWARVEEKLRNFDQARTLYEEALDRRPIRIEVFQGLARLEQRVGNIERARELYRRMVLSYPKRLDVFLDWAKMEERVHNIDEARELYERAAALNPYNIRILENFGQLEMKYGNVQRGEELFGIAVDLEPQSGRLWRLWSSSQLETDPIGSLTTITRALKFVSKPDDLAGLFVIRGRALARIGNYFEAERAYQEALNISEINAEAHYFYAVSVLEAQSRIQDACAHLKEARVAQSIRLKKEIDRAAARLGCDPDARGK